MGGWVGGWAFRCTGADPSFISRDVMKLHVCCTTSKMFMASLPQ